MSDQRQRERVSGRKRAETHKTGYERTTVQLPDGVKDFVLESAATKRIAVIPFRVGKGNPYAEEGSLYFERTFWVHRGIGATEESYVCLAKTAKQKCPICEYRAKLAKDPTADEKVVADLAPKERQLWNVLDLDDLDGGVKIWDISFHLFGKRLDEEIKNADEGDGYEFFADPEDGCYLKLGVLEKTFNGNKFYEVSTVGFKPRREPLDPDVLKSALCLDNLLVFYSYDKLKAILFQTDGESEESTTESRSSRSEKPAAKKPEASSDDGWSDEKPKKETRPAEKPEPAEKPAAKAEKPAADDWDDDPPPKKEKPKAEPAAEKPKAAAKTAVADDDDWGDEPAPKKEVAKAEKPKAAEKPKVAAAADDDDWG